MLFQVLDFVFSISVSLGSVLTNEAVFLQKFSNGMKSATIEQQSLSPNLTSNLVETSFDVLNNIEFDDLESIITNEFAQGLRSDSEIGY